jgi:hypothetical protein
MASSEKFMLPITFHPITGKIVEQLKVLNSVIFPIKYQVPPFLFIDLTGSTSGSPAYSLQSFIFGFLRSSCETEFMRMGMDRPFCTFVVKLLFPFSQEKLYKECLIFQDLTQGGRSKPIHTFCIRNHSKFLALAWFQNSDATALAIHRKSKQTCQHLK